MAARLRYKSARRWRSADWRSCSTSRAWREPAKHVDRSRRPGGRAKPRRSANSCPPGSDAGVVSPGQSRPGLANPARTTDRGDQHRCVRSRANRNRCRVSSGQSTVQQAQLRPSPREQPRATGSWRGTTVRAAAVPRAGELHRARRQPAPPQPGCSARCHHQMDTSLVRSPDWRVEHRIATSGRRTPSVEFTGSRQPTRRLCQQPG